MENSTPEAGETEAIQRKGGRKNNKLLLSCTAEGQTINVSRVYMYRHGGTLHHRTAIIHKRFCGKISQVVQNVISSRIQAVQDMAIRPHRRLLYDQLSERWGIGINEFFCSCCSWYRIAYLRKVYFELMIATFHPAIPSRKPIRKI